MKLNLLSTLLASTGILTTASFNLLSAKAQTPTATQFICADGFDPDTGKPSPTTFAWTPRGKTPIIRWQSEAFKEWNPQQRCEAVSPRFHEAYHNGSLHLITNGIMNNQRVICTAKELEGDCDTLLLTLRSEDKSVPVLNHLRQLFNGLQIGPIKQNSSEPQIYYQIDIEKFLNTAPVEK